LAYIEASWANVWIDNEQGRICVKYECRTGKELGAESIHGNLQFTFESVSGYSRLGFEEIWGARGTLGPHN
jgi:hypothetical protein